MKFGATEVQSSFCITRPHLVATVPIDVFVNRQINFQNKFSGWADVFQIPHQHKYVDVGGNVRYADSDNFCIYEVTTIIAIYDTIPYNIPIIHALTTGKWYL